MMGDVLAEQPAQVRLPENDDMVYAGRVTSLGVHCRSTFRTPDFAKAIGTQLAMV